MACHLAEEIPHLTRREVSPPATTRMGNSPTACIHAPCGGFLCTLIASQRTRPSALAVPQRVVTPPIRRFHGGLHATPTDAGYPEGSPAGRTLTRRNERMVGAMARNAILAEARPSVGAGRKPPAHVPSLPPCPLITRNGEWGDHGAACCVVFYRANLPANADCRGGVFATRRFPRPPPS